MRTTILIAALASIGCSSAGTANDAPVLGIDLPILDQRALRAQTFHTIPGYGVAGGLPSAPQMAGDTTRPDRKVIFNASLAVLVGDGAAAERDMCKAVDEAKGWIHKIDGTVFTLRVPAPLFDAMLDKLTALGRVLERKVSGTDVSEEYRDLELRLKNAEDVRKRLAALLEKAKDVKETLEVERELARVSEEIERLKGKLQAMSAAVEYSTIVVNLARNEPAAHPQFKRRPQYPFAWVRKLGVDSLMEFRR